MSVSDAKLMRVDLNHSPKIYIFKSIKTPLGSEAPPAIGPHKFEKCQKSVENGYCGKLNDLQD